MPTADNSIEQRTQPACKWLEKLEVTINELFRERNQIREQIRMHREVRHAVNPIGEGSLSQSQAHQVAKSHVLGVDWQNAQHSLRQARQSARSAGGQLERSNLERRLVRERSNPLVYWLIKAPYLTWKARGLKRRLREATHQRRSALRAIRVLRPSAVDPVVRERIFTLSQQLLISDERLGHDLQNLQRSDQKVSCLISEALRLAPQLRSLGDAQVSMEQQTDPSAQKYSIPRPLEPLESIVPRPTQKVGIRIR